MTALAKNETYGMLICAPEPRAGEARISLADGCYDDGDERVFWRDSPDRAVLRLPLAQPHTVRQLPAPAADASIGNGLRALRRAVEEGRAESPLSRALRMGDADVSFAEALLLWRQNGLADTYDEISECLAGLASAWAAGAGSVLAEHWATRTASQVIDRLAALTPAPSGSGAVVLAVPTGDQHTVALPALAHLLADSGWPTTVVEGLPLPELIALAAAPGTAAVVISAHTAVSASVLRQAVLSLRTAAPDILIVLGGPGLPARPQALGADLVTTDPAELLRRLETSTKFLTDRECEVLTLVADGRTNGEIATALGVAPATVKSHLDRILTKTETDHRAGAVAVALRRGWIT